MKSFSIFMVRMCFSSLLLLVGAVHAQDKTNEGNNAEARVSFMTNMLSQSKQDELREQRAKEDLENREKESEIPANEHPSYYACEGDEYCDECNECSGYVTNGAYYYNNTAMAVHKVINMSNTGSALEIEDGSVWDIEGTDQWKTCRWLPNQSICLTPNHSWFSSYRYRFVNIDRDESAATNMSLPPYLNNVNTHWIEEIDYNNRLVRLENGTIWKAMWLDAGVFSTFNRYDVVIIGINDGWWSGSNPQILIHLESMEYVRGKQY